MNILMFLSSHDKLGDTGRKTGFWLEEFAAPYCVFTDAGAQVTLVSPKGGQPPLDPKSDEPDAQTDATRRFKADDAAQSALAHTGKHADVSGGRLRCCLLPGWSWPLVGPGGGQELDPPDRGDDRRGQAGGRRLPRAGGAASCPWGGWRASGQRPQGHRLHY